MAATGTLAPPPEALTEADIFDLNVSFDEIVKQFGPLAPEWEAAFQDRPAEGASLEAAPTEAQTAFHRKIGSGPVAQEAGVTEVSDSTTPQATAGQLKGQKIESKWTSLRTKIGRTVGRWILRGAVVATVFAGLSSKGLGVHQTHEAGPGEAPGAAPAPVAVAPLAPAAVAPAPKVEVVPERSAPFSVFDMIPDPAAPHAPSEGVVQVANPVQPTKRIIIGKGDTLGEHLKQALREQGLDPAGQNYTDLIERTKAINPGLTNENIVFENQPIDIPMGPAVTPEQQKVKIDYQAVAARYAKELQKVLPDTPYTWLTSICVHGVQRYNQAFTETPNSLSPQQISALVSRFWDANPASRGYSVRVDDVGNAGTERYIDDGNWNALQQVLQYAERKKRGEAVNESVLGQAQAMLDIGMANYDPNAGLVRWKKQPDPRGVDVFTTISTAGAAELALMLNEFTKDPDQYQKNLQFAISAYEGTRRTMQDPATGVYFDGLSGDGKTVDTRLYSYNTGIMISDGMWLYQATGDKKYLTQAEETAAAALKFWDQNNIKTQDAALVTIYLDRLLNLGMVTDNEQLRDQINQTIMDYANWYGSAPNLEATKGRNSPWRYAAGENIPGEQNEAFAHYPSAFAATQMHVASLAAIAQDRQEKNKGSVAHEPNESKPAESKKHTVPSHILAQAKPPAF